MSLRQDQDWATSIYQDRAELVDADEDVTCFFLESYSEICRYMRVIGYGSKGKAESVEAQVARGLVLGRYCSLRTTVRGKQSAQEIALFIYYDLDARLVGSGLVVVSFETGGEWPVSSPTPGSKKPTRLSGAFFRIRSERSSRVTIASVKTCSEATRSNGRTLGTHCCNSGVSAQRAPSGSVAEGSPRP